MNPALCTCTLALSSQRGAAECQACNERIYLAAVIRLRLRRAE